MTGLEVINGTRSSNYERYYLLALQKGWRVGALGDQDNHGPNYGDLRSSDGDIYLTGVLADSLTKPKFSLPFAHGTLTPSKPILRMIASIWTPSPLMAAGWGMNLRTRIRKSAYNWQRMQHPRPEPDFDKPRFIAMAFSWPGKTWTHQALHGRFPMQTPRGRTTISQNSCKKTAIFYGPARSG